MTFSDLYRDLKELFYGRLIPSFLDIYYRYFGPFFDDTRPAPKPDGIEQKLRDDAEKTEILTYKAQRQAEYDRELALRQGQRGW